MTVWRVIGGMGLSSRLIAAVVAALGMGTVAPGIAAAAEEDALDSRPAAQEALQQVERLVDGRGIRTGRELTPALLELRQRLSALDRADRKEARGLLARPTDTATDPKGTTKYTVPEETPHCTTNFCIHWVATTGDAPDVTDDSPADGIPDYVEQTATEFEFVYQRENVQLGWRQPKSDGTIGGGEAKTDVYIKDLGATYGYAAPDSSQSVADNTAYGYVVVDDDYDPAVFHADPVDSREVTAAHEYNHVLQFAYDVFQDIWMFESTAVWMEDKVYDGVNDYRQYLGDWAASTEIPLTESNRLKHYGTTVWNQWLESEYGEQAVRVAWEQSLATEPESFAPFAYGLAAGGAPTDPEPAWRAAFTSFAAETAEWRTPGSNWPEARGFYPDVERVGEMVAGSAIPVTATLDHATFGHFDVTGAGSTPITLEATLPAGLRGAIALVGRTGSNIDEGTATVRLTHLPGGGSGSVTLEQPGLYGRITAVLINADVSESGYDHDLDDWDWTRDDQPFTARVTAGPPPDSTPPDTTITSGPTDASDNTPTFGFSSSEPGSFTCRIDSGPEVACGSPYTTQPLPDGPHSFEVRATDTAGNADPSSAVMPFTIATPPPDTDGDGKPDPSDACPAQPAVTADGCPDTRPPPRPVLGGALTQSLRRGYITVTCRLAETGSCSAAAIVTVPPRQRRARAKTFRLAAVTKTGAAGSTRNLRLKISPFAAKTMRAALARRARVSARVTGTAKDEAGNRSLPRGRTIRLKR